MPIDPAARAQISLRLIMDKPSTGVVFTKPQVTNADGSVTPETPLAAQTVRINSDSRASVVGGAAGLNPTRAVMVYGIAGVNDIDEGYEFAHEGEIYRVVQLIPGTPGVIQAQAATAG